MIFHIIFSGRLLNYQFFFIVFQKRFQIIPRKRRSIYYLPFTDTTPTCLLLQDISATWNHLLCRRSQHSILLKGSPEAPRPPTQKMTPDEEEGQTVITNQICVEEILHFLIVFFPQSEKKCNISNQSSLEKFVKNIKIIVYAQIF